MKDTELAWLAGLIDGEGCFHIRRSFAHPDRVTPAYTFSLLITMGSADTIKRVHEVTRIGFVTERREKQHAELWSKAWTWWGSGPPMRNLILALRPYLVTKRDEADIALRFLALPRMPQRGKFMKTPPELCIARALLWDDMRRAKPTFRFRKDNDPVATIVLEGWRKTDGYRAARYGSVTGDATLPGL